MYVYIYIHIQYIRIHVCLLCAYSFISVYSIVAFLTDFLFIAYSSAAAAQMFGLDEPELRVEMGSGRSLALNPQLSAPKP